MHRTLFVPCSQYVLFIKVGTGLFRPLLACFENGSGLFWLLVRFTVNLVARTQTKVIVLNVLRGAFVRAMPMPAVSISRDDGDDRGTDKQHPDSAKNCNLRCSHLPPHKAASVGGLFRLLCFQRGEQILLRGVRCRRGWHHHIRRRDEIKFALIAKAFVDSNFVLHCRAGPAKAVHGNRWRKKLC